MTPESIEHYTKQFKYLSKTFLPIFQKFCLFWPQTLQEPKTFQKNPTGQLPSKETYLSSLLGVWFFPILSGAPQSNGSLPKSSDGKTSRAWLNARRFEDHENNFLDQLWWGWRSQKNNKKKRPQSWNGKLSFLSGLNKRNEPSEIIWNIFFAKTEEVPSILKANCFLFCFFASEWINFFCLLVKK